ncbi:MAG TPA: hypothetical protein VFB92_14755 [Vicinamibacterales bacterium]|nr:hypothetical protein [Vicinamibacterales bacterium]
MKAKLIAAFLIVIVVAAAVWWWNRSQRVDVRFATAGIDFARLDHEYPLSIDERESLTPEQLAGFSQEEVDQIYGRLTAGPIPDGVYDGDLFFPRGTDSETRLGEIIAGRLQARIANLGVRKTESLGRLLWKGKVFYRDQRLLRNRIEDLPALAPIMGGNTDGIEKLTVNGRDTFLLFPARLYCGQSLLDGRRESVIIDYAFTDELPGYREAPDALGGRNGFRIRDEIRMVRPGFYLGRAYMKGVFGLNFTLINREVEAAGRSDFRSGRVTEDCWAGTQVAAGL